nr:FAD-dependent oxidoreductase [Clostridia bacterium]
MSDRITINIDGRDIPALQGQTVLEAAQNAGIEIANLCKSPELAPYGACGLCVVEAKGVPKLLRACSATVSDGMEISTNSPRVEKGRRLALELIMGDHDADCVAPCSIACPAHTDCQKYIRLINEGKYDEAVLVIKEKIPLPSSIGRVCPHPCETQCRRQNVENSISICALKAFASDTAQFGGAPVLPEKKPATGKSVGIIGGGPAGLTAAYFLALEGHSVTVYDKMPKAGGMLRYGIPEYRLPKKVLDAEIAIIESLGVEIKCGVEIGTEADLEDIRARHDALIVANGAWKSSSIRCKGEELEGVFGGIDFLREVALGNRPAIGDRTAIVGGGNTAMDACRTAVRLGAKEVSVIYRRTRDEMPAEDLEIDEAIEEGVNFLFLTNPDEIIGENGRVSSVRLQKMRLGEPDERGRRSPVPIEGEFVTLGLDSIIIAAGQKNSPDGFTALRTTKRGTIEADENTLLTSMPGVFAAGDCTNKGAGIAIEAIAEGGRAAKAVDAYLLGAELDFTPKVISKRRLENIDFSKETPAERQRQSTRPASERRNDFLPVAAIFTEDQAKAESARCLQCGCHAYGECRLIRYADMYKVDVD